MSFCLLNLIENLVTGDCIDVEDKHGVKLACISMDPKTYDCLANYLTRRISLFHAEATGRSLVRIDCEYEEFKKEKSL